MPNTYYKGGGGAYIAHASKHVDGGDDEITLPLDLGAIPNDLIGKNADKVDGYDAGNTDGKVLVLPTANPGDTIKRGSSNWEVANLYGLFDLSWRRFIRPNYYYPLPPHFPGANSCTPVGLYIYAQPFILPGGLNITEIWFYVPSTGSTTQLKVGFYNDSGNFKPYQRLWYETSPYIAGKGSYTISVSYNVPKNTNLWLVYMVQTTSPNFQAYSPSDLLQLFFPRNVGTLTLTFANLKSTYTAPNFNLPADLSSTAFDDDNQMLIEFLFKLVYV
jgi:hypothetical protein